MKYPILFLITMLIFSFTNGQSVIQTINSGSFIASNSMVSIGEILITPVNSNQSSSGLLGIVSQVNQNLEVPSFDITENITVFPNPTFAKLNFNTQKNLVGEKLSVYDMTGKLILQKEIENDNTIDLSLLSVGVYLIQFENKNYKPFKIIKN